MTIPNATFAPLNSSITTANVEYPVSWMWIIMIVVGALSSVNYNEHYRTFSNLFFKDEYRNAFTVPTNNVKPSKDETDKLYLNHPFLKLSSFGWMVRYMNPILSMCFVIVFQLWTWIVYASKGGGIFLTRDQVALWLTSAYGLTLVVYYSCTIAHIYYTSRIVKIAKSKQGKVVGGVYIEPETAMTIIKHMVTIYGKGYEGINGCTHMNIRVCLYYINILWGLTPAVLASIGISWDRAGSIDPSTHIPNVMAGLIGFSGFLLTIIYIMYTWANIGRIFDYYAPHGYFFESTVEPEIREMVTIGLDSDTMGPKAGFKGNIPKQYIPSLYKWARVTFVYPIALLCYNDILKSTAWFVPGCVLLLFFTAYSEENSHFIAYDVSITYHFFIIAYWLQAVCYPTTSQSDVNMNLITLNQDANYPLMEPYNDFGTSIMMVASINFIFTVFAFFQTVFGKFVPQVSKSKLY